MTNVVYINMCLPEEVLMDNIGAQISRLKTIVGRRDYPNKGNDILDQIEAVDAAIQELEDFCEKKWSND